MTLEEQRQAEQRHAEQLMAIKSQAQSVLAPSLIKDPSIEEVVRQVSFHWPKFYVTVHCF